MPGPKTPDGTPWRVRPDGTPADAPGERLRSVIGPGTSRGGEGNSGGYETRVTGRERAEHTAQEGTNVPAFEARVVQQH